MPQAQCCLEQHQLFAPARRRANPPIHQMLHIAQQHPFFVPWYHMWPQVCQTSACRAQSYMLDAMAWRRVVAACTKCFAQPSQTYVRIKPVQTDNRQGSLKLYIATSCCSCLTATKNEGSDMATHIGPCKPAWQTGVCVGVCTACCIADCLDRTSHQESASVKSQVLPQDQQIQASVISSLITFCSTLTETQIPLCSADL